jgi:hypothetical protein
MNPIKDNQRDLSQQAIARWENEGGALEIISIRDEYASSMRART